MTRAILTVGTALCLLTPSFAQDAGLPGGPTLPSAGTAAVNTQTPSSGPTVKDVGVAVVGYLGDLISENPTIEVGAWYALGNYPGAQIRFNTDRLGIDLNQGIGEDAPHRRSLRFADVIDDTVIVEFRQDAERFRGLGFNQTDVTGGYRFDTAMPIEARFEAKLFHDTPSDTGYDRYRAVLNAESFDFGDQNTLLRGALTMRVGLERASIDGNGATRFVAGQRLALGMGDSSTGRFDFYVDVENAIGGYDAIGRSRGFTGALGATVSGADDAWTAGFESSGSREVGPDGRRLKIVNHRLFGSMALNDDVSVDGYMSLFRVKNHMTPSLQTGDMRFRSGLGIGYKWLHAGTEIGQDLDGKWRPRVTAGVRIPLGN